MIVEQVLENLVELIKPFPLEKNTVKKKEWPNGHSVLIFL